MQVVSALGVLDVSAPQIVCKFKGDVSAILHYCVEVGERTLSDV